MHKAFTSLMRRSYLYVPGDQSDKLARARDRGADAVILDLEDAVAPRAKDAARREVRSFLEHMPGVDMLGSTPEATVGGRRAQLWVRINPGEAGLADIAATWHPALTGVVAAKIDSAEELDRIDAVLAEMEHRGRARVGSTSVVPLLESSDAVLQARSIASRSRVLRLQIGEADLTSELGLDLTAAGGGVLAVVRALVLLAGTAAGLDPPVAPVSTDFRDLEALRRSTLDLAGMGYFGRACIHPAQLAVVNGVFTPTAEAVADARLLVDRFEAHAAAGRGVMVGDDGRMVDEAVIRQARRMLTISEHDSS